MCWQCRAKSYSTTASKSPSKRYSGLTQLSHMTKAQKRSLETRSQCYPSFSAIASGKGDKFVIFNRQQMSSLRGSENPIKSVEQTYDLITDEKVQSNVIKCSETCFLSVAQPPTGCRRVEAEHSRRSLWPFRTRNFSTRAECALETETSFNFCHKFFMTIRNNFRRY